MSADIPKISIVLAIFNEEESLEELYERITATLEAHGSTYEVIAVDDGSADQSFPILREIRGKDARWRIAHLTRNFGQSSAIYAGFSLSRGEYVLMIDADLQVYPEDIPLLLAKLDEGYDMASGWRVNRHDNPFRKVMSRLLNLYTEHVTGFPIHDHGCSLKGFRRPMVERMVAFTHRCRYLPVDAALLGGKVAEVPVRHQARPHGHSKYGLFKLFRTAFDMITSVTTMPLQFINIAGILFVFMGGGIGAHSVYYRLAHGSFMQLEVITALFLFLTGVQLSAMGLMCEYVGRIYIESQRKPLFIIDEEVE
ncbi:MAG: glycosyltransferase [Candidatus Hydrogenedentes bacterium]|nr:glycosyltransferase [Candidatus Hydrogenedentota bacterium]